MNWKDVNPFAVRELEVLAGVVPEELSREVILERCLAVMVRGCHVP